MTYGLTQAPAISSGAAASTTKSYTISPTAGDTVVLVLTYQNANAIGVTAVKNQSGTALTYYTPAGGAVHDNASYGGLTVLVLPNVPSGITSIVVTVDTSTVLGLQPFEYSGLWTSAATAGANSGMPTATLATDNLSQSVTPTQQPAMLWSVAMDLTHNSGPNAGTGFTSRALSAATLSFGSATYRVEDKRITSTSATNATFTNVSTTGDQFIVVTMVIPEPPPPPTLSLPTPSGTIATSSTATLGGTTDTGNGTVYAVLTTSSLTGVTVAQIKAGQNAAGSTSGVIALTAAMSAAGLYTLPQATGLTASQAYSYAEVQNSTGGDSNIISGTLTTHAPVPTISSVTPSPLVDGAAGTITGTTFGSTKGTGHADLAGVAQTTTAWADTSITETVAIGANAYGTTVSQTVTNNAGDASAGYNVTINPATGWSYVNIGTPNTTAALRLTTSGGGDLASGDQVVWGNIVGTSSVTVFSDGTFVFDSGFVSFDFRVWTPGSGWGSTATVTQQTVGGVVVIVITW